jgi:hypothetical protein
MARRTRTSRKRSRRWFIAMACIDGRFSDGNSRFTTLPVVHRRKIIGRWPRAATSPPRTEVHLALLEGLERRLAVAVELDPQPVEIVDAAIDRQVAAPIVGDALIFDGLTGRTSPTL